VLSAQDLLATLARGTALPDRIEARASIASIVEVVSASPSPRDLSTSIRMSRQRRRDTTPELELRRILHAAGYRFRLNVCVPGMRRRTIDVAFTRVKVAVFIDGCFWHVCPEHATWPRSNAIWWREKLEGNVARDRETDARLSELGWEVVRIWEHEDPRAAAVRVEEVVRQRADRIRQRNRP